MIFSSSTTHLRHQSQQAESEDEQQQEDLELGPWSGGNGAPSATTKAASPTSPVSAEPPSSFSSCFSIRNVALVSLAIQNATSVLLMHHVESPGRPHFSTAVANVCTEILKFVVSIVGVLVLFSSPSSSPTSSFPQPTNQECGNDSSSKKNNVAVAAASSSKTKILYAAFNNVRSTLRTALCTGDSSKMIFIAIIYAVENNLFYVALRNVPAAVFQVVYQMKLIVTAVMLRLLLGRKLSTAKWLTLFVVFFGIVLTEHSHRTSLKENESLSKNSASASPVSSATTLLTSLVSQQPTTRGTRDDDTTNFAAGLLAVVGCAFCSAFACSYFEAVIKEKQDPLMQTSVQEDGGHNGTTPAAATVSAISLQQDESKSESVSSSSIEYRRSSSLFVRNTQLAAYSVISNLVLYVISVYDTHRKSNVNSNNDGTATASSFVSRLLSTNPLNGFDSLVLILVVVQACGGLLVSMILKHGDAILKALATAVAIVLNGVVSLMLFGFHPTAAYVAGALIVIVGVVSYAVVK